MEILVHVSAPSTIQDDARYRAQVAAILAFQTTQQEQVTHESTDTRDSPRQPAVVRPESVTVGVQDSHSPSPRSDHLPTIPLSGQALNFESIATRIGSSRLAPSDRGRLTVPAQDQDDDSLETRSVVSVIPDSQPETICPPSETQVNPCRSNGKPDDSHSDPPSKRCRIESALPAAMFNSGVSALPTTTPDCFIPPNPIPVPLQGIDQAQSSTNHDHAPNPSPSLISISQLQNPSHILPLLPLEIHPPLPAISTASFTTHITPTLSMFTTRLKPDRTYKPLTQTRPLHDLERGYWFIPFKIRADMKQSPDPNQQNPEGSTKNPANSEINLARPPQDPDSNWTLAFFQRFWSFLEDFVGKDGRAGWGVWCVLEHASNTSSPTVPVPGSSASAPLHGSVQMQLKVYAWGEIAMHVYLLLFLASERQVRKMGLQWRDYDEKVVIQMP